MSAAQLEVDVMQTIVRALDSLDVEAAGRVVRWTLERYLGEPRPPEGRCPQCDELWTRPTCVACALQNNKAGDAEPR